MSVLWESTSFEEAPIQIIDGDRGNKYPKQEDFSSTGYCLFLNTSNVLPDGFNFSACQFVSESKDRELRKGRLSRGDVVLTTRGTIGNIGIHDDSVPYDVMRINSGMVILRADNDNLLPSFLFQFLRSALFKDQVESLRSGAAQPQLPIRDIKRINLPLPNVTLQRQIVSVLCSYDNLIAANQRQIQLLEESARLLYREWFVKLRFPGHETVAVVDGVPEGWEKKTLGEFVTLNYGKSLKETDRISGDTPVYGSSGIVGNHNKPLITGPAIIVGRKGNVGSVYYSHCPCFPIDTVYFVSSEQTSYFLYLALQGMNFISSDAAVPGLNRNYAYSLQLIVPGSDVFLLFETKVQPIFEQINSLVIMNKKLRQARDLLLPKLMSGALDASRITLPKEVGP